MPKNVYFWSAKETAQHSTERHQIFQKELYPYAKLPRQEFLERLEEFKEKNFDLLDSEKSVEHISDVEKGTAQQTDSKLNNKLEVRE